MKPKFHHAYVLAGIGQSQDYVANMFLDFQDQCNALISAGYIPHGTTTFRANGAFISIYQAFLLPEEK